MTGTEWPLASEQRISRLEEQARQAQDALRGLTGTASSASGAVTVTVGATGALRQVVFTERTEELSRPKLAEAVLEAARKAHAAAARDSADALRPLIGEPLAERFLAEHAPGDPGPEPWR